MNQTTPEPPGGATPNTAGGTASSTAVQPDPSEDRGDPRPGIDTEHLRDYRALRRSVTDRKIAGVCGGLARHLDLDPTLVRVVMVVLAVFGGAGLVLYAALWLLVPEEGLDRGVIPVRESARNTVIVVALVLAVLLTVPAGLDGDGGVAVPVVLAGLILAAVLLSRDSSRAPADSDAAPPDRSGATHPTPGGASSAAIRRQRRGPLWFGTSIATIALAVGILGLVDVAGATVPDAAYPALALAVIGGFLVLGAFVGRAGGLIALGLITVLVLVGTWVAEPTFSGQRDLLERPVTAAQLDALYDVPAGRAEIDLTGIADLEELDGRSLAVEVNAGEIVLVVPEGLEVDLDARVSAGGEIATPGLNRDGWDVSVDRIIQTDVEPRAVLRADLKVGFGRIEVRSQ